jgi:general secretion pathway protein I
VAGFTLLEVMVALAIVAIALVTLLGLATRSITVNEKVQRITRATLLAQQRLAELETSGAASDGGEATSGQYPAPFEAFQWRVSYADTPLAFVREVTVTVAWGREERNEAVALTSFLLRAGGGL